MKKPPMTIRAEGAAPPIRRQAQRHIAAIDLALRIFIAVWLTVVIAVLAFGIAGVVALHHMLGGAS